MVIVTNADCGFLGRQSGIIIYFLGDELLCDVPAVLCGFDQAPGLVPARLALGARRFGLFASEPRVERITASLLGRRYGVVCFQRTIGGQHRLMLVVIGRSFGNALIGRGDAFVLGMLLLRHLSPVPEMRRVHAPVNHGVGC
ncbi:MAG TPA: hypothetical protein VFA34_07540 [Actinomycetota bacterium]|nr:hypothetical protein [Actinomycetota bacterium]